MLSAINTRMRGGSPQPPIELFDPSQIVKLFEKADISSLQLRNGGGFCESTSYRLEADGLRMDLSYRQMLIKDHRRSPDAKPPIHFENVSLAVKDLSSNQMIYKADHTVDSRVWQAASMVVPMIADKVESHITKQAMRLRGQLEEFIKPSPEPKTEGFKLISRDSGMTIRLVGQVGVWKIQLQRACVGFSGTASIESAAQMKHSGAAALLKGDYFGQVHRRCFGDDILPYNNPFKPKDAPFGIHFKKRVAVYFEEDFVKALIEKDPRLHQLDQKPR